jgi:hypothetical protein
MLGTSAPYPMPVITVIRKNIIYPMKPVGTIIVNVENIEKINAPAHTIHFRTILSAKYPKINIKKPVANVKENVSTPKGVVSPPNPK